MTTRIAFLGVGLMGAPMARNLIAAGFPVTIWNRTHEKAKPFASSGARVAATPEDAAQGADIVISVLADGPTVTEVLFDRGVAAALARGAMIIDMSSIAPAIARTHATRLSQMGVDYLDAPVSGGVKGATEASLAIMVGGAESTFARAQPAFAAMGRATLVGPNGSGQLAKLANQAIVGITIEAVAEALLLAAAGGADPAKVREALMGGFADSKILSLHGQRMLDRNWLPGGAMRTHLKDMRTILAEADIAGVALPAAKLVGALFGAAVEHGFGGCDHSGLLLELERANPGKRVGEAPDQRPTE